MILKLGIKALQSLYRQNIPAHPTCLNSIKQAFADPENFLRGGGVQIPRRGPTENFNMAKINNLAIPGGGPDPLSPPLDPPMTRVATGYCLFI